ncbi:IctB family putative bicarbonate transporter [Leptolyngbya sp. FACHB-261]|uniref:IctB family putative bicarbonate transporter n=1 Tax=Leptolyngbya sp. FACHB-261 TaxID=2692806 RepID=UPI0016866893|nr:IctB family putative bicarbonate transporter [Leptolyngbya sp. FACHB-261]MBD2102239.1 putative bicarbonate transporter, IctB family [Leptolyngbya sp. FACHB-261]
MALNWQKKPLDRLTLFGVSLNQLWSGSWMGKLTNLFSHLAGSLAAWRRGSALLQWGEPLAVALLSLSFGIAPYSSTTLIGLLLFGVAGFWALLVLSDSPESGLWTPTHRAVSAYWFVATAATVLSPVKAAAFSGWSKLTLYLLLFVLLARLLRQPRYRSWLVAVYLLTALIVSIYGLRQWFFGAEPLATWTDANSDLANTTRVYSYLRNPNLLASYLLPAVPLGLVAALNWQRWPARALALMIAGMSAACVVLTFSRGGWIGLLMSGTMLAVLLVQWWSPLFPGVWRKLALPGLLGALGVTVAGAILGVPTVRSRFLSIFVGRGDSSNNFRMNVWQSSLNIVRDHLVIGIGPGNEAFNQVYPLYQQPGYTALGTYCVPLEIAVETGVVGLGVYAWLVSTVLLGAFRSLKRLSRQRDREAFWLIGALAAIVGLMGHGLVDTVWYRPQVQMLWWLVIGLVVSFWQPETLSRPIVDAERDS